jgi:hypothetical protein
MASGARELSVVVEVAIPGKEMNSSAADTQRNYINEKQKLFQGKFCYYSWDNSKRQILIAFNMLTFSPFGPESQSAAVMAPWC